MNALGRLGQKLGWLAHEQPAFNLRAAIVRLASSAFRDTGVELTDEIVDRFEAECEGLPAFEAGQKLYHLVEAELPKPDDVWAWNA